MKLMPNLLAGVGAGRRPEFIEMMQAGVSHNSGSTRVMAVSLPMRTRVFLAILLVATAGCRPHSQMGKEEAAFAGRPRNYNFELVAAETNKPEPWHFSNTPTFWETNHSRLIETVNGCLTSIGLPVVTNQGVRLGRISEVKGGWIYYGWSSYPAGPLNIIFVEEYGMQRGEMRVFAIEKPEQPNFLAGVGAGLVPEFIEMRQAGQGCGSGSSRLVNR